MDAKADWAKIILMEEISWRQKSRALWLQAGDRNTKFFHRTANMHRRFNSLSTIEVDRVCYDTLQEMKSTIWDSINPYLLSLSLGGLVLMVCLCLCCNLVIRSLLKCPSVKTKFLKPSLIAAGISLPIQME